MRHHILRGSIMRYYGLNRTLCDVLRDMRELLKTEQDSPRSMMTLSLIEEAQVMANRMEAALSDIHDIEYMQADLKKIKKELKALKKEKEILSPPKPDSDD